MITLQLVYDLKAVAPLIRSINKATATDSFLETEKRKANVPTIRGDAVIAGLELASGFVSPDVDDDVEVEVADGPTVITPFIPREA